MTNSTKDNPNIETPLDSWKEIAAYLQRDVRTLMRWEKHEGLPVHRHHHLSRSSVYAYPSELEAWRANRQPVAEPARSTWWRPVPAFASTITIALALLMAGSGPHIGTTVQAADGIVTRQMWTGPDADQYGTPSPDGRYLSFTDWSNGDLAIRDLTTGANRRLTHKQGGWENWHEYAESSMISPDSKQVAFEWQNREDYGELRIVDVDGSGERLLYRTEHTYDVIEPADWSRDGRFILARHKVEDDRLNRIVTVSVADGSMTVLKTLDWRYPKEMRFSPDRRYVVYDFPVKSTEDFDLFVLSLSGGQVTPLVQHPGQDRLLGWSPDGRAVLFLSDRTGTWGIWMVPVAGGKAQGPPVSVKRDVGPIIPLGFTEAGAFYYAVRDPGYNIYSSTVNGETPALIVNQFLGRNLGPAWSPDGKQVAYARGRQSPPLQLRIRTLETGDEREYLPALNDFVMPLQWSPDGQSILVRGQSPDGKVGSYRIDLKTGHTVPVLLEPIPGVPVNVRWSADGKAVYFHEKLADGSGGYSSRLVRRDLATGRDETVSLPPRGVRFTGFVYPSPDGQYLALWVNRAERGDLALMPAGGGELRFLTGPWADAVPRSITWTPDSRRILFIRQEGKLTQVQRSALWSIPAEGGEAVRLGFSTKERVDRFSIHPDGKRLAFTLSESTVEVWAMENFLLSERAAR